MSESILTRDQKRTFGPREISYYGRPAFITATVRLDDEWGNGHNTFSITGEIRVRGRWEAGGCLHDEIAKAFPELAPLIRWHLCSTDGPLHYIENTMYWLGWRGYCDGRDGSPPNLDHARKSAVWPDMPDHTPSGDLASVIGRQDAKGVIEAELRERLPGLMAEFRAAVEAFGLVW